jgi:predicted acylesterase/phospholipase RssA
MKVPMLTTATRSDLIEPLRRLQRARKVGFLFSGGAARCAFQIGVVETLFGLGIQPSACLGISGGAWNAAAVAVGNWQRLRAYWRFFCRMPCIDVTNLAREHSPFAWRRLHQRAYRRYVGETRLSDAASIPLYVALTRLRDRAPVIMDARSAADPLEIILASNYLPPFFTHAPVIGGERYGDAAFSDNLPYEALFERGCDAIVLMSQKGECEGGLFRKMDDTDHVIPDGCRDNVIVIRPVHRLVTSFAERRWERLSTLADLGAARARQVLLAEASSDDAKCRHRPSPSSYVTRLRRLVAS